ncbi:MAG TPA: aminoglycoside phosphotransferase [Streptosporangiaceae bacterium]|nr:aminoglycoside phosphotransferase [Streptosporangiaceae bacterium]
MSDRAARAARPLGQAPSAPAALAGPEPTAALLDLLAAWLPRQRWFPGRGDPPAELSLISDVTLEAHYPALRHLIVEAPLRSGGAGRARFQVLVGYRPDLPSSLHPALIGSIQGVACYDALHDAELADVLLRGISERRLAGQLRFVREPGAPHLIRGPADARVLGAEQSNTSVVFGDHVILKMLRRLFPGANPDLEVVDALARLGSKRVATPYGWIETDLDGEPVLLGVLSQFLAGASDGWLLALDSVRGLAGPGSGAAAFAAEARLLGQATAELHTDLAAAFGGRDMTAAELARLTSAMQAKLSDAIEVVPELGGHEARIRAAYDAVPRLSGPVRLQRVHGDYHLGQVLRAPHGWVALDFEGEPAVPLAMRRGLAPALRDVAGMLRSFDYAARHELVGEPAGGSLAEQASAWVAQSQDAFCAGYAAAGGADPAAHAALLRALTLEKAVYEVVYEYRHRPSWLSIPLGFVAAA